MPTINNYDDAAALFAKARHPAKGKPLDVRHWRLFKDGDEFVVNYLNVQVCRFLPTGRLIVRGYGARNPPQGVVATVDRALPFRILRRGPAHYRVHAVTDPKSKDVFRMYGVTGWEDMLAGGAHLWHDVTFDLTSRVWLSAPEVTKTTDPVAHKDWMCKSRHIRSVFAAMIRIGAVSARIDALAAAEKPWYSGAQLVKPTDTELAALVRAVDTGTVDDALLTMFAQSCRRTYIGSADTEEQLIVLSNIFKRNSLALRTALGVVTVK
jgi:hypothetical protein